MPTATAEPPPPKEEAGGPFAEDDLPEDGGEDGPQAQIHWVSLDAKTGRLLCPSLGIVTDRLTGRITESRLVRVFGDGHADHDEEGGALCASSDRRVADHGRPGRECAGCDERHASCSPRWRIVWEEPGSGLAFAHTLSAAGTVAFTRYTLTLRRAGLRPWEALTRICPERLRQPGAEKIHWRLRFEKGDDAD